MSRPPRTTITFYDPTVADDITVEVSAGTRRTWERLAEREAMTVADVARAHLQGVVRHLLTEADGV